MPELRDDIFIGSDDVFTVRHSLQDKIFSRFDAAHKFDDDFNFGVVEDFVVIIGSGQSAFLESGNFSRQDEDFFYVNRGICSLRDYVAIVLQNFDDGAADCSRA